MVNVNGADMRFIAIALFSGLANLTLVSAAESGSRAQLRWKHEDLVLTIRFTNPLSEAVDVYDPDLLFARGENGNFGSSLKIRVFSRDDADTTRTVFQGKLPRQLFGSVWGSALEARATDEIALGFAKDLRAHNLPKPGWKVRVKLVGYTAAQNRSLVAPSPEADGLWRSGKTVKIRAKDETVLFDGIITVPAK